MNKRKRILPLLSLGLQMLADRRLHYDSKMTSCHVCYSSRAGGRMFNVLIYELGTILEKKRHVSSSFLLVYTAQDYSAQKYSMFMDLSSGRTGLPAFTYQIITHSGVCSWRTFQTSPKVHVRSCERRKPLANLI